MIQTIISGAIVLALAFVTSSCDVKADDLAEYRGMKYGFFAHYAWGGPTYPVTVNPDGSVPKNLDDLANRFDAEGFAADLDSMGVEYVLFTAWHANMNLMYPSAQMERWRPGHSSKRDVLRDLIEACRAKGIRVLLYTHPRDGHDFSKEDQIRTGFEPLNYQRWNDFINSIYGELMDRYGRDILGVYIDEGGKNDKYVDYPRLRETIKLRGNNPVIMQNDYGNLYSCDMGNKEIYYNGAFGLPESEKWPGLKTPVSIVIGSIFWAATAKGRQTPISQSPQVAFNPMVRYSPESMFRYTVLQAATNCDGGGTLWAAGPYPGGGWEMDVKERMQALGKMIKPVERAIKRTYPSNSYVTEAGKGIGDLTWGVATRSIDDNHEYIHVLKPLSGRSLALPPPADGKRFRSATFVSDGRSVRIAQARTGVTLALNDGDSWSALDTVIDLVVSRRN